MKGTETVSHHREAKHLKLGRCRTSPWHAVPFVSHVQGSVSFPVCCSTIVFQEASASATRVSRTCSSPSLNADIFPPHIRGSISSTESSSVSPVWSVDRTQRTGLHDGAQVGGKESRMPPAVMKAARSHSSQGSLLRWLHFAVRGRVCLLETLAREENKPRHCWIDENVKGYF